MEELSKISTYIDRDDILEQEKRLLDNIVKYSSVISEEADRLSEKVRELEAFEILHKTASMLAIEYVMDCAEDAIKIEAQDACINSQEYDYGPYVNHLLTAISANIDKIVSYEEEKPGHVRFHVKLESLGEPEDWIKISRVAAQTLRKGTSYADQTNKDMFWRNYIFRAGRQGKIIVRKQKSRRKGPGRKKVKKIDETEKYATKYADTIRTRLSFTPRDKAPFWYFLEYGNISVTEGDGEPYPKLAPYPFKENIQIYLSYLYETQFDLHYQQVLEEIERVYDPDEYIEEKTEELSNLVEGIETPETFQYEGEQPTLERLDAFENGIQIQYEIHRSRSGKTVVRARAKETGRMVKGLLTEALKRS